jgi:hypothetical protein
MIIYLPREPLPTSASSAEWPDSTLESERLSLELAASVTVSGKLRQQKFWSRELKKGRLTTLPFFPTSSPSQQISIAAKWLRCVVDGHVLRQALLEPERGQKMSAGFCLKSSESFAKLTRPYSWEKTFPEYSLFKEEGHGVTFSQTWPQQGSMQNGECFLRKKSGRHIAAIGLSSSDTSRDTGSRWPTARTTDTNSGRGCVEIGATGQWPTPKTLTGGPESAERKQELGRTESGGGDLQSATGNWGTPTSRDWKDGSSHPGDRNGRGDNGLVSLSGAEVGNPQSDDESRGSGRILCQCGSEFDAGDDERPGCWRIVSVANSSDGLVPQQGRGSEGRDGAGEAGGCSGFAAPFFFAPGPSDPRWPWIVEKFPWLSPAISTEEVERTVRHLDARMADTLANHRADALRAAGNGVTSLCASYAFITLAGRAGII